MRESQFQSKLIARIEERFPGCMVLKNDSSYLQGVPDLLVLYKDKWAALEVKRSPEEPRQPNQDWYIREMSRMSYANYVFPQNEEDVLDDLQRAFRSRRAARVSQR